MRRIRPGIRERRNYVRYQLFLSTLLIVVCPLTMQGKIPRRLKKQLVKQGFSGALEGKVHVSQIGTLQCSNTELTVFYYEWEESHPPGQAIHFISRLIFMDSQSKYLGHYVISDRPTKTGSSAIYFDYPETVGNRLERTSAGLPQEIVLDGEQRMLEK